MKNTRTIILKKFRSRRLNKRNSYFKLYNIIEEIRYMVEEKTAPLIYRQFINHYDQDKFDINLVDDCSHDNLKIFHNERRNKDTIQKIPFSHGPANLELVEAIETVCNGWFSSGQMEIIISGNMDYSETKLTLIHEFSHYLHCLKFINQANYDFLQDINDEYEAYLQEKLISGENLMLENMKEIRQQFEKRHIKTINEIYKTTLEDYLYVIIPKIKEQDSSKQWYNIYIPSLMSYFNNDAGNEINLNLEKKKKYFKSLINKFQYPELIDLLKDIYQGFLNAIESRSILIIS